jgi:hypothetical protein
VCATRDHGIALQAKRRPGDKSISSKVEPGKALIDAGLHPASDGDGSFACSLRESGAAIIPSSTVTPAQ